MAISEADYLRLDALAARGSASARRAFLAAMNRGLNSADTRKLRLAIQHGDGSLAVDAVNWLELEVDLSRMFIGNDGGLADGVGPLAQAASRLAGHALGRAGDNFDDTTLDALTQRALAGVGESAGSRVRRISDESRRGLRELVQAGFDESRDFAEIEADVAALLRADGGFGLDERSAGAIARREASMRKAGVTRRDRDRIVRKLKVEALQRRARLVATTELQDIGNEAMLATWREAERESGATIWKVWRTRGDEACPRCQALDFQSRRLNERFSGLAGDAPMRPLLHPHCYCWLDMVMVDGDERTPGGASRSAAPRPVDQMARAASSPVRAEQRAAQNRARRRVARVRQERSDRMRAINAAQRPAPPPTATTRQRAQRSAPAASPEVQLQLARDEESRLLRELYATPPGQRYNEIEQQHAFARQRVNDLVRGGAAPGMPPPLPSPPRPSQNAPKVSAAERATQLAVERDRLEAAAIEAQEEVRQSQQAIISASTGAEYSAANARWEAASAREREARARADRAASMAHVAATPAPARPTPRARAVDSAMEKPSKELIAEAKSRGISAYSIKDSATRQAKLAESRARVEARVRGDVDIGDAPTDSFIKRSNVDHAAMMANVVEIAEQEGISVTSAQMRSEYGEVKMHLEFEDARTGKTGSMKRTFMQEYGKNTVSHSFFVSPTKGDGFGKRAFAELFDFYHAAGVDVVKVHANIDVGGYAWARYGFLPEKGDWRSMQQQILGALDVQLATRVIDKDAYDTLRKIASKTDPRAVWELVDAKVGFRTDDDAASDQIERYESRGATSPIKAIMARSGFDWYGRIDFDNEEQMARVHSYLAKGKKR